MQSFNQDALLNVGIAIVTNGLLAALGGPCAGTPGSRVIHRPYPAAVSSSSNAAVAVFCSALMRL